MSTYLKLFETHDEYQAYSGGGEMILPNVSHCIDKNEVHYTPLPYQGFCKLALNDGSTVELEGSGELTQAMVSDQYKGTLVSAEIGTKCTSIGQGAFRVCGGLTSVTIPDSVTSIGANAFRNCSGLTNVTIGNGVTNTNYFAFAYCSSLTSVDIPNSVTNIGEGTFNSCSGLTSITIPDSVTSIGDGTFAGCSGLTSVTIGSGVTSIGNGAFNGCSNLSMITSHITNAPSVYPGTFAVVKNGGTLYVPIGSSGYETWMNNQGNLGMYNWTKVEQ